ncbi:hypothetical protein FQR65_LT17932 [Abscondita terminalis]|nr:hypothetical protein FQR65_LT17932 [Abscondita terminalis]
MLPDSRLKNPGYLNDGASGQRVVRKHGFRKVARGPMKHHRPCKARCRAVGLAAARSTAAPTEKRQGSGRATLGAPRHPEDALIADHRDAVAPCSEGAPRRASGRYRSLNMAARITAGSSARRASHYCSTPGAITGHMSGYRRNRPELCSTAMSQDDKPDRPEQPSAASVCICARKAV